MVQRERPHVGQIDRWLDAQFLDQLDDLLFRPFELVNGDPGVQDQIGASASVNG